MGLWGWWGWRAWRTQARSQLSIHLQCLPYVLSKRDAFPLGTGGKMMSRATLRKREWAVKQCPQLAYQATPICTTSLWWRANSCLCISLIPKWFWKPCQTSQPLCTLKLGLKTALTRLKKRLFWSSPQAQSFSSLWPSNSWNTVFNIKMPRGRPSSPSFWFLTLIPLWWHRSP